ncbi:ANTAR domain-containing protein [Saccharothrix saharensis]|uniref:ANTAR domain-containing protein n=1 Tax=Saccharothrix saharensis TaxID=571190 RepID=UPI00369D419E
MAGDHVTEGLVQRLDDVTGAVEGLSEVLDQEEDLAVILDRICGRVVRAVPRCRHGERGPAGRRRSGDRAATRRRRRTWTSQYRAAEGPCLHAARSGEVVHARAAEVRDRWPAFGEQAAGSGVACFLAVPLCVDEDTPGSLNLYSEQADGFRALDVALLELYTTAAEAALRNARRYVRVREHAAQLRQALTSRAVIDQAKGVVMAVHRVTADEAFAMLVDRSQRENVKLRDFAERFITNVVEADS